MITNIEKISATDKARELIAKLQDRNGAIMFHQSGGCCDGSQPMCFTTDDFKIGESDIKLGTIYGADFWMSKDQYEYWKHTHLTLDVVPGRGSSFSLEIPMGVRFIIHSRLLTSEERKVLNI
ncbi:DUF779 domain-containing protein [Neptunitalea chrysea]|nr:DUF779 domain-containing protein [Neptunitalea chrysea]